MFKLFLRLQLWLVKAAEWIPLGNYKPARTKARQLNGRTVLLICAHCDDESMSMMPLGVRYQEEGYQVVCLTLTIGKEPKDKVRRRKELLKACNFMGIQSVLLVHEGVLREIKSKDPADHEIVISRLTREIAIVRPHTIILHGLDRHPDHIAVCNFTLEALKRMPGFSCVLAFSEFWGKLTRPNVQVQISVKNLAFLLKALSFHVGELSRNPYHLLWPFMLMLNRLYSEVVSGWGGKATPFPLSALYEVVLCTDGMVSDFIKPPEGANGIQLALTDSLSTLMPSN